MSARTMRPRRLSRRARRLLLGVAILVGLALLWVGPALAEPSPAPGPAPSSPGTPGSPTAPGVPDPGAQSPGPSLAPSAPTTPSPLPQPSTPPSTSSSGDNPAWYDIGGQVRKAVVDLVVWAAEQALQPVMEALGKSWLSTPDFTSSPAVQGFWTTSLVVANAVFVLFIVAGGFLITSQETLQTRYGLKQVLPRLAVGAVAANCSLIICGKAIEWTNALTVAFAANSIDGPTAATAIRQLVDNTLTGQGFLMAVLVIAVIVMCLVLEITFVLRLAALILLAGIAPAALICHASPLTEGIAHTWWRAFTACLGLQIGQALVVMATVKVFLTPAGPTVMGIPATGDGLLGVLVCLTMLWVLVKMPTWMKQYVLGPLGQGGGRSLVSRLVNTYLAVKSLGAAAGVLRGVGTAARAAGVAGRPVTPRPGGPRRRLSPAGPAAFSHAPVTHTPLPSPAGTNAAPAFSDAPSPAGPGPSPTGGVPAARFSRPPKPETPRPAPAAPAARVAFSDAAPATAMRAGSGRAPGVRFSSAPAPQTAQRRPPAPVTPVFSTAPSAQAAGRPRGTTSPAPRPTAAQQASPPARASDTAATRSPGRRTPSAQTANASITPATTPARRAPAPTPPARPANSASPPPPPPTAGSSPAPSSSSAVRTARPTPTPPPLPPSRRRSAHRGEQQ